MRDYKTNLAARSHIIFLAGFAALATAVTALAFPPAPYHTLYGMVRDEMGQPIMSATAVVTLTATNGVKLSATVTPNLAPGMNYRLLVPMDSGLTAANYTATALRPYVSFSMKVLDDGVTYLPMEVLANFSNLGQPAGNTRMDLTLARDSDGDGLPDAWEQLLIDVGLGQSLADIQAGGDSDGDGITNLKEYLAGTYAFDPADGFKLELLGIENGRPLLEFMALPGRTYTVRGSTNMTTWSDLNFSLAEEGPGAPLRSLYSASDVRILRISADVPAGLKSVFFKAMVQ